jgi:choline dehydrogenase-like flavoprotein
MAEEACDVVVVGGGAAGCVLAARLAERNSRSVLLLEAGPDRRADLPRQLRDGWTIERESFDWGFESEPHAGGEARPVRRKRLLGGTSWLTRFTPRGSPADYDGWAGLGLAGWSWEELLPYFVKLESDVDFGKEPWHGDKGPIPSSRQLDSDLTEVGAAALDALEAAGFPRVDDHNQPGAVGAGRMPMNVLAGDRVTTADAYVPLHATPHNLTIRGNSQVDRVVFDGAQAVGVRLVEGATVNAGHVVLCAGVYGSPAILLRSGIGSEGPLVRLPGVGANLVDHPSVYVDFGYRDAGRNEPALHTIATFHSSGRPSEETPDLMLWLADPIEEDREFGAEVVLLRPRSRGSIRLRSSDPRDPPLIELPNLSDPVDVKRLAEGYRRAVEVATQVALRRYCSGPEPVEPKDLEALIRTELFSVPHTVGTCAMGSVVDASGSVFGVECLSVVDASIMPDVPSGFTHIPTIMIAERLSEQIASRP